MKYELPLTDEQRRQWGDNWETGYMLKSRYQKQGYATEAISPLVCRASRVEKANRVYAFCNRDNTALWNFLENPGFRREGLIRKNIYFRRGTDGKPVWQDTLIYGILRDEWAAVHMPPKRRRWE